MRPVRLTRAQQQALTRERLLAAAERVLARHGYSGASIDLVTAEAGYSKGAIYSNFESKEAVFLELLRVYMERDMAELGRIVSLAPHQLSAALSAWLETMHADSDCPLLMTELQLHARRNPVFAERYYALQDQQTRALARILERFFEAQSVPLPMDPLDLARGHGHGPIYLPLDHRSLRRTAAGDPVRTAGCSLSVYDPYHLSGRIVIESMSLFGTKLPNRDVC